MHGLASSAFARHYSRNHNCFLFLRVLRCFTSPRSLQNPMCSGTGNWPLNASWVSPFGHPRITARLPTPRGLSQAPTSFIGSWYQDIHRLPLVACHKTLNKKTLQRCSRPLYSSQNTGRNTDSTITTYQERTLSRETTHPSNEPHQQSSESRPQPPTTLTHASVTVTLEETIPAPGESLSRSWARFLRTQQRASAPHSFFAWCSTRPRREAVLTGPEEIQA